MYIYDFFDLDILMVHGSFDIAPLQEAITNLTLFNFKRHLVLCTKVASTWPGVVLKLSFKREAGEMRWLCIRERERENTCTLTHLEGGLLSTAMVYHPHSVVYGSQTRHSLGAVSECVLSLI